jgi:hypothetical protein
VQNGGVDDRVTLCNEEPPFGAKARLDVALTHAKGSRCDARRAIIDASITDRLLRVLFFREGRAGGPAVCELRMHQSHELWGDNLCHGSNFLNAIDNAHVRRDAAIEEAAISDAADGGEAATVSSGCADKTA